MKLYEKVSPNRFLAHCSCLVTPPSLPSLLSYFLHLSSLSALASSLIPPLSPPLSFLFSALSSLLSIICSLLSPLCVLSSTLSTLSPPFPSPLLSLLSFPLHPLHLPSPS